MFTKGNVNSADYGICEHVTPTHESVYEGASRARDAPILFVSTYVLDILHGIHPPSASVHSDTSEGRPLSSYR